MLHRVLYYKAHGHGNQKKPTQWAAMPPFFAWPSIQKPSRRACPAGLRVLQSSSSSGGCFIDACAAGPSFAFEGNSALKKLSTQFPSFLQVFSDNLELGGLFQCIRSIVLPS